LATLKQIQFVENIEAGAKYLVQSGRGPMKLSQILEASGQSAIELSQYIHRLAGRNEYALLIRLKDAFASLGVAPKGLLKALHDVESKTIRIMKPEPEIITHEHDIEHEINPIETEEIEQKDKEIKPVELKLAPMYEKEPMKMDDTQHKLIKVLEILENMNPRAREKVITTASVYFGVGE